MTCRETIEAEVWHAVRRAVCYVETIGVVSRRGTDGIVHEPAKLTFYRESKKFLIKTSP